MMIFFRRGVASRRSRAIVLFYPKRLRALTEAATNWPSRPPVHFSCWKSVHTVYHLSEVMNGFSIVQLANKTNDYLNIELNRSTAIEDPLADINGEEKFSPPLESTKSSSSNSEAHYLVIMVNFNESCYYCSLRFNKRLDWSEIFLYFCWGELLWKEFFTTVSKGLSSLCAVFK